MSIDMQHAPNLSGSIKVSVVIPVHNEGTALDQLLPEIISELNECARGEWEILVVDDGSTDKTATVAMIDRVKLFRHATRQGSGAARKTGSREAKGKFIAWIDGDGTYAGESLAIGLRAMQNADQVVGVRSIEYGYLRVLRLVVKNTTNRIAGCLWKTPIPDLNSGMRIFRRESLLAWIEELPDGFSCTSTATLASLNHRQRLVFFPISYRPRSANSSSKFHPVLDTLRLWRAVWRCWLRRC